MGLFSNILEKLGLKKEEEKAPVSAKPAKPQTTYNAPTIPTGPVVGKPMAGKPTAGKPMVEKKPFVAPMREVDVVAKLEKLAKAAPQKLDWKVSIVDMLKLLGLDSSLEARKELATELGCPKEKIGGDYAEMNKWLHKTVLAKIASNGGNIPRELL